MSETGFKVTVLGAINEARLKSKLSPASTIDQDSDSLIKLHYLNDVISELSDYANWQEQYREAIVSELRTPQYKFESLLRQAMSEDGFGTLKMVNIDGMPYVMNMVDTLNSIAAPYFTFALSTREHPEKGKRFFTIKNLACQPFRILITYDGDPVYLYTQAEQQTQWFTPGSWNDIGYGTEFFSAPDNCTTSTEY